MRQKSPEEAASWCSRLYFRWMSPTLRQGMVQPLDLRSLLPLNASEEPNEVDAAFCQRYARFQGRSRPVLRTLASLHARTFAKSFGVSMMYLCCSIASPLVLRALLKVLSSEPAQQGRALGWFLAAGLFASALGASMAMHHLFHMLLKLMMRVRTALVMAIYRKALLLTVRSRQQAPSGQIINLMGTDAQKFVNCLNVIHTLWMHPMQISAVLIALFYILGPSAAAGAVVLFIFLFLSALVARQQVVSRRQLVRHTDDRVGLVNEVLMSIRILKFYAWERSFFSEVQRIRRDEVLQLRRLAKLSALATLIFLSAPVVVSVATFAAFVLSGHALRVMDVFPALALFTLLRQALVTLPDVVTNCLEANVSLQRVERFLELPELKARPASHLPVGSIEARGACVEWVPGVPALSGIDLTVKPGQLIVVVGAVGSGKSALMSALLGDLSTTAGSLDVAGSVAYVSQQAWILNATVQQNILFGSTLDPLRYATAVRASGLAADMALFPNGDATEIGERGVNLSGGQRQRISLARALYSQAAVVLLDDPLSALDNRVGQLVYEEALLGAMAQRTRILTTHRLEYVAAADQVLVLDHGRIVEQGTLAQLRRPDSRYSQLWRAYEQQRMQPRSAVDQEQGLEAAAVSEPPAALTATGTGARLMTDEERLTGGVAWAVYALYFKAFTPGLLLLGLVGICFLKEGFGAGTDAWLAFWTGSRQLIVGRFLLGYLALGLGACSINFSRSLLISLRGLAAGNHFHDALLRSVLKAPMSFFEATPVGRLLNRFSRDMEAIDQQIPRSLHEVLGCVFTILTTLTVIIAVMPLALPALIPIGFIYWRVQRRFRPASREGQRLDSITRSPLFALFSESLSGMPVIRAFAAEKRFERELLGYLATNSRTFYTIVSANRWLGTRIESLGAGVIGAAALGAVAAPSGSLSPGFAGLALTYALMITSAMNWAVRMFSQLESNLNSVERVDHYARLPAEAWEGEDKPVHWPTAGAITFERLELRYRPDLPKVIKGLSLSIAPGERLGIVGRTGSGKSSLLLGLFRILEASSGRIIIDGVDITKLSLAQLRGALAIIPQEPVLFRGTIRKNLDPFGEFDTAALDHALARAELQPMVQRLPAGLDTLVHDGGSNFSVGQRQLLCLARAILKKSRILLLDEATASVDIATDALIQRTIRSAFRGATTLTIAHRLSTVMDADRILVLSEGHMVECDSPQRLAQDHRSAFSALLRGEHG